MKRRHSICLAALIVHLALAAPSRLVAVEPGLLAYWKLHGDCKDYSASGHDGINHDVDLATSEFNGRSSYVEVPDAAALKLANRDFSISAWVCTENDFKDPIGDVLSKYDAATRTGFHLSLGGSAPGYNSSGNAKYVRFGMDHGAEGTWSDCGRPGGKTNNSDALTVFRGGLYCGITDAPDVEDWAHVFRYRGGQAWEDCGRVGNGRTRGVYAMIVHDDALYAATSASHGPQPNTMDFGHVYRYQGGKHWEDLGQPGMNYRLNSLASFQGRLYVCAFNIGPDPGHCYVYEGGTQWTPCGEFEGWPHTMAAHDGKLYTAYPKGEVFAYDGKEWKKLGNPFQSLDECNQIHSLGVFRGELYAGTWPKGKLAALRDGKWVDCGRLGDATEIIGLTVYNGTFFAGTIPRAEIFRFETDNFFTSVRRLFDPPNFQPVPVGSNDAKGVADWSRTTSMTVFGGKLFVSTGTCYRTMIDPPVSDEIRGRVYAFEMGENVSHDQNLGAGWKHLVVVRDRDELKLYVDGQRVATAKVKNPSVDISNNAPLRIGFGEEDYFSGKIREVRLYSSALGDDDIRALHASFDPAK